jgi:hypothetical protein
MDPRVSKRLFCSFYNLQYFPRLFFRKYASLPDGTIPVFEICVGRLMELLVRAMEMHK